MCGIHGNTAGYVLGREALHHRGPDSYGVHRSGDLVLEHWRLSIIDLSSNGAQPMVVRDHDAGGTQPGHVIAYNGEVYNFRELKATLPDVRFNSSSDTEVVLQMYARHGEASFARLDGMFACAIHDEQKKRLVLARDRFGIKPLYFHVDAQRNLYFASELGALTSNPAIDLELDVGAIRSLFHLLYIEGESTPFTGIRKLPPASYLVYDLTTREIRIERYHQFEYRAEFADEKEYVQRIDDLLAESVRMHLIADVPVGALLSGGVDSSLLVALMKRHTDDVHTFSVGYSDSPLFDESRYFNQVARKYGTHHHHKEVRQADIAALVDEVCDVLDEPIGDTSVFLNYYIFGFVGESVKVCLSGLGGDELFGGYNRYMACRVLPVYTGLPRPLRAGIRQLCNWLPSSRRSGFANKVRLVKTFISQAEPTLGGSYQKFIDYYARGGGSPVRGSDRFVNERFEAYWDEAAVDEMNRIFKFDAENYMVNDLLFLTDRMSMRHSVEARVPYLENNLFDYAARIVPTEKTRGYTLKYPLKKVAERYLPREVIYRRKQGFSSPTAGFLTAAVLDELARELRDNRAEYVQILDRELFERLIGEHRAAREDHSLQIFTLLVYLKWMKRCYQRIGARLDKQSHAA